jgi:hypothetical protein
MFNDIDAAYYSRRAEEERRRANEALDLAAAETHKKLAQEYETKAKDLESERESNRPR